MPNTGHRPQPTNSVLRLDADEEIEILSETEISDTWKMSRIYHDGETFIRDLVIVNVHWYLILEDPPGRLRRLDYDQAQRLEYLYNLHLASTNHA